MGGSRIWSDLVQPGNFFEESNDYIMISCSCLRDGSLWFGSVYSKLKQLNNAISRSNKNLTSAFCKKQGNSMIHMLFIGVKMIVQSAEIIQDPLYNFTDLCMSAAINMNSVHSGSFSVNWQILSRAEQKISMGSVEKPSCAAVAMGGESLEADRS